jgi:hypothetical protein
LFPRVFLAGWFFIISDMSQAGQGAACPVLTGGFRAASPAFFTALSVQ